MAPLPANATARLWVHYQGEAGPHEMMFRFAAPTTSAEAVLSAHGVCDEMKVLLTVNTQFDGARWAEAASDISFPVPWTTIVGTSSEAMTGEEYPNFITFLGRDLQGRRVRWTLNGIPANADTDYRIQYSESTAVSDVVDALRSASPPPLTIGGMVPIIYNYADLGRNAYFQRKRRRSA